MLESGEIPGRTAGAMHCYVFPLLHARTVVVLEIAISRDTLFLYAVICRTSGFAPMHAPVLRGALSQPLFGSWVLYVVLLDISRYLSTLSRYAGARSAVTPGPVQLLRRGPFSRCTVVDGRIAADRV